MAFKMKGSPAKMGTIQGTAGHASALKKAAAVVSEEKKDPSLLEQGVDYAKSKIKQLANVLKDDDKSKESKKVSKDDTKDDIKKNVKTDDKSSDKKSKKSSSSDPYSRAVKNDPNVPEYVKTRKTLEKGSRDWVSNQWKINKAYYGEETANRLKTKHMKKYGLSDISDKTETKISKIKDKGTDKQKKITDRMSKKVSEVDENVSKKEAKLLKKDAKKTHGKGSLEHLQAKLKHLQTKQEDIEGTKGGKKRGLFRKAASNISKKRQENIQKKIDELTKDSPVNDMKTGKYKQKFEK